MENNGVNTNSKLKIIWGEYNPDYQSIQVSCPLSGGCRYLGYENGVHRLKAAYTPMTIASDNENLEFPYFESYQDRFIYVTYGDIDLDAVGQAVMKIREKYTVKGTFEEQMESIKSRIVDCRF